MVIPRVILIGGVPCVGKSAVSRKISARFEYGCISVDDIGKAIGAVCPANNHMNDVNWQEYFTETPVETFVKHFAISRERIWPFGARRVLRIILCPLRN